MDAGFHDAVLKVFIELYEKGYIFKGKRLVNWDPHFETAISDVEVKQVEVDGKMWHLRYKLENGETYKHPVAFDSEGNPVKHETRDYLVVATTRPETMLGDTGVAVHPDDPRYSHLVGKTVCLPLANRSIPIVADSYADPTKGTGAVKMTPAHDFNDREVGVRQNLPAVNVMSTKATMHLKGNDAFMDGCAPTDETMSLDGLDRYEARERIVQLATRQGWLDKTVDDRHTVPHGDRSKVAIEPYLTDQWFVDAKKMVKPAIKAVTSGQTRILPERYAKTYFNWLENIEPWCISRQLWWGHQIPVWYDSDGREYCAATEEEAAEKAGGRPLTRDPDVLDTWFSSGLWPIGTLGWPDQTPELRRYFPTDVLVTGFDIIFFWVARMMMMQLAVVDNIPFHTVYVHALVRDQHGKKMAKSLGNVIDPLKLIEKYGADAVRFTLASMAAMGRDLKLAESRVKGYRNFATKIWNAARFAEMNECIAVESYDPTNVRATVNRWMVGEAARVRESVDEALRAYKFNEAANTLYSFVRGKFCDWYLEFTKPLLSSDDSELAAETRSTFGWTLDQCLIMLHPFMPFITEEIWSKNANRAKSLVHADWPYFTAGELANENADLETEWVIRLIEEIRSVKSRLRVPPKLKLNLLELESSADAASRFKGNESLIKWLAKIENFGHTKAAPKDSAMISVDGAIYCLPLSDVIDVGEERKRLAELREKSERDIDAMVVLLKNPKFVSGASAEVVEQKRAQICLLAEESDRIKKALECPGDSARQTRGGTMQAGVDIEVSGAQRERLEAIVYDGNNKVKHATRARIILLTYYGLGTMAIMAGAGTSRRTVYLWQERFMEEGVEGLLRDKTRRSRKHRTYEERYRELVDLAQRSSPNGERHWTVRALAKEVGIGESTARGILAKHRLAPQRVRQFNVLTDLNFTKKTYDAAGLYIAPSDRALVLRIDEETWKGQPMELGQLTTLLAELNTLNGMVVRHHAGRHWHQEFIAFLNQVDKMVPAGRPICAILNNDSAPKHRSVMGWLAAHSRWTFYYPSASSSWTDAVEGIFGKLAARQLWYGEYDSIKDLKASIQEFKALHNEQEAKPFRWKAQPGAYQ